MLTLSQRRSFARAGARSIDAQIAASLAEVKATEAAAQAERAAAAKARLTPVPFTEAEYKAARAIRTTYGWRKVVRANLKSVTVETGYSWTDRVPRHQVLEVKA